jgi:hypothetical protein
MPDFYHKFGAASPMAGVFLPSSPSIEQDGYGLLIYILDLSASRSLDVGSPNWDKMRFGALRTRQNEIMAFLEVWALGRSPFSTWETLRFVNLSRCSLSPVGLRSTIASVCVFLLTF